MSNIFGKIARNIQKGWNKLFGSGLAQDSTKGIGISRISDEEIALIRRASTEGIVLLKNDGVLPLSGKIAVFGRCQIDTFYVGYGSGGDVKAPYKVSITEGLMQLEREGVITLDKQLLEDYRQWCKKNPPNDGYWGHWPMNYPEMPVSREKIEAAAKRNQVALVVIGRAAGEDRENKLEKGSYYLTDEERIILSEVTSVFAKTVVVLDCGNIIDLSWTEDFGDKISALVYAWHGGMEFGNSLADVLSGKVNPCGRLTATIAKEYTDYPSSVNFGHKEFNEYAEDIFVGYRYFETFAQDRVMYPFGFGLSYTNYEITVENFSVDTDRISVLVCVKNVGRRAGKEVVQLYMAAPQGSLGKASKTLVAFEKTILLSPKEVDKIVLSFNISELASYDDTGITGNKNCFVIEKGKYAFFIGSNSRDLSYAGEYTAKETAVVQRLHDVCGVRNSFYRIRVVQKNGKICLEKEIVSKSNCDLTARILSSLPRTNTRSERGSHSFKEVLDGKISLEEFVGELSETELEALTRGYGCMGAPQGPSGNAGTYGGVIAELKEKGVPVITTTDGPAGIRLNSKTALLPCGTALASSWDLQLVKALYNTVAEEMRAQKTHVLLAPGMNIQRDPLCGRNFEYFSEDPLLTGKMASAVVKGLQQGGVAACPKHFACNNQETNRSHNDSRVSERALREIYLKCFEICIKEAKPLCIMSSYNKINGVWSHYNYDLCTVILREEWGFDGLVLTDWWMRKSASPEFPKIKDNAYRVRAQVDVLMPGNMSFSSRKYKSDGTLLKSLGQKDGITRAEIERCAANTLKNIIRIMQNQEENNV